jgi:predicted nucleic acid-binding protein
VYYFYFDASALVKRYTEETGSDKVDYLFVNVPLNQLKCLTIGAAEVFWICVRKKNDGRITPYEFTHAVANLNREVTSDVSDFRSPALLHYKYLTCPDGSRDRRKSISCHCLFRDAG